MTPFLEMKERAEKAERALNAVMIEHFRVHPDAEQYVDLAFKLRRNNPGSLSHDVAACRLDQAAADIKEINKRIGKLEEALRTLISFASKEICPHEETHRGGAIWEICDQCGAKWADDEGGKPEFKWPKEITNAQDLLNE